MTDTCDKCLRPLPTDEDKATMKPGEGSHLCWGGAP